EETGYQRLRARALNPLITGFFAGPVREFADIALFLLARVLKSLGIAARGHHQIDVDADHFLRMRVAEPAGDGCSPIAALRGKTRESEHVMHHRGDAIRHFRNAIS